CESRRLLRAARDQSSLLEELERRQPGISAIQRDTAGRILIEEEQGDFNSLIQEIQQQVKKSERALSLRKRK
ncbi:response regulator receiver protein, partial [Candidatus Endoriftia persephone str. Guaymas]|nr:response regulator receiver protein [Candidatus Endoriftia persephone str. Guaymas]